MGSNADSVGMRHSKERRRPTLNVWYKMWPLRDYGVLHISLVPWTYPHDQNLVVYFLAPLAWGRRLQWIWVGSGVPEKTAPHAGHLHLLWPRLFHQLKIRSGLNVYPFPYAREVHAKFSVSEAILSLWLIHSALSRIKLSPPQIDGPRFASLALV